MMSNGIAGQISFGGAMGLCAGVASRRITNTAAFYIGVGFLGLEVLQHFGYIQVDWMKVQEHAEEVLDQDGDGKVDGKDWEILRKKYMGTITQGLVASSGFAAGFALGFKWG